MSREQNDKRWRQCVADAGLSERERVLVEVAVDAGLWGNVRSFIYGAVAALLAAWAFA